MSLTSREKQAAYRERLAAQGIVSVSLEMPQNLVRSISSEARAAGKTRGQLVTEKLKAKPKKQAPVSAPLPADISKEADRIVHLIGQGLRASTDKAAADALNDALNSIYGLANMAAAQRSRGTARRKTR